MLINKNVGIRMGQKYICKPGIEGKAFDVFCIYTRAIKK